MLCQKVTWFIPVALTLFSFGANVQEVTAQVRKIFITLVLLTTH
jgi:hypothetical protein